MVLLFDVDEHTGGFGGAKAYFEDAAATRHADGVMIGYPGLDHVVTGGRGVLRAHVHVHGTARAFRLQPTQCRRDRQGRRPDPDPARGAAARPVGPGFPLPARLTVTTISGGEGYSMVPDVCTVNVDIRLTPALDDPAALALLRRAAVG